MVVLVVNCGSSSLKFQLFDMRSEEVLARGLVERIGLSGGKFKYYRGTEEPIEFTDSQVYASHANALEAVLKALTQRDYGVISDISTINAVGHRVAHGGELFTAATLITEEVLRGIKDCISLAPLHNPANVTGIDECMRLMPGTPQVAVFDTAFHQTMPEEAYLYAIPYAYYQKHKIRRYGFHGSSHRYVAEQAAELLNKPLDRLKLISCHLGNGSSICAIKEGRSIDTSMGFTPLEGLPMGSRSGTIDPAIIEFLVKKENMSLDGVMEVLNKKSGVYGISGVSSDFRDLEQAAAGGNHLCDVAIQVFCRSVKKYIGSYYALLEGLDALIFTAGIGENSALVREKICTGLEHMGIKLDRRRNLTPDAITVSAEDSKVKIMVISTNEELLIARDAQKIILQRSIPS